MQTDKIKIMKTLHLITNIKATFYEKSQKYLSHMFLNNNYLL